MATGWGAGGEDSKQEQKQQQEGWTCGSWTEHTGDNRIGSCRQSLAFNATSQLQGFLDSFTEEESVVQEGSSIVYHSDGNMLARYLLEEKQLCTMITYLMIGSTLTWMHLLSQEGSRRRKNDEVPHPAKKLIQKLPHQLREVVTQLALKVLKRLQKKLAQTQMHRCSTSSEQGQRQGDGGPTKVIGRGGKNNRKR